MIDLNVINMFNVSNEKEYELILTKDDLIKINKIINENSFINNEIDFITFNFYKKRTFITINSLTKNKEQIQNVKTFNCINKELLFKDVYELNNNEIQEYIKVISNLSRIYVTIPYALFKYLSENIHNTFVIQLYNNEIKVSCDGIDIPNQYYIYKK